MADCFTDSARTHHVPPIAEGMPEGDLKIIGDAVADMNIARKSLLIYPASHDQVQRTLQRAFTSLQQATQRVSPLAISVSKGRLHVGPQPLPVKSALFRELSLALKERGVVAVTLINGLGQKELMVLLKLLSTAPDRLRSKGGIARIAAGVGVTHIVFQEMDYSRLHLTEEASIRRRHADDQQESTWRQFVRCLVDSPSASAPFPAQHADQTFEPAVIADLLNEKRVDGLQAVAYYEALAGAFVRQRQAGKPVPDDFKAGLERFHQLIRELKPPLRQQFLSVALEQCTREMASTDTAVGLIGGLGADLVVEMLRQANHSGRQISPSFLAFINKMGISDDLTAFAAHDWGDARQVQASVDVLLSREAYESYVDDKYHRLLGHLAAQSAAGKATPAQASLGRMLTADLEKGHVLAHTANALQKLMAVSLDTEEYRDWARQLSLLLDDLAVEGCYGVLTDVFDAMTLELRHQQDPERRKIAGLVIDHFHSTDFVTTAMAPFNTPEAVIDDQASALLDRLGEALAVEALDGLAADVPLGPDVPIYKVLERCAPQAAQEAIDRLDDMRPAYVCRMLEIVRCFGQAGHADDVKPLLGHEHAAVRLTALDTLLAFHNPWGVLHLRELLAGPWSPTVQHAVQLAGKHGIRDVVPTLMTFVSRIGPLAGDLARRESALRALGAIGDPQAMPVLTRIARRRWVLSKRRLHRLKQVLYESLAGYPFEMVKGLLQLGLEQRDANIVALCEHMLKERRQAN